MHDIGLIGLAVMGQNLVLNMECHGYQVAVYNRTTSKTSEFLETTASGRNITATYSLKEFIAALKPPRKVMIMVKSGPPVDAVIDQLTAHLEKGDLIIDGGNSYFKESERRAKMLAAHGILFLGTGISGGEEGAFKGPSIMPGGQPEAYRLVQPIFESISAKVAEAPCVAYMGPRGAGHFVKMVHNGIEYGDMQLIAEAYDVLNRGLAFEADELSEIFHQWNQGVLSSYLIEITSDIFKAKDPETSRPLVDVILDQAGQKGTGRWTGQIAMDLGVPTPTINAAVEARILSGLKDERKQAAVLFPKTGSRYSGDRKDMLADVEKALYLSKICSYAQGMALLRQASLDYAYDLNYADIARIWRGGCIIRAEFLNDISEAFEENPHLLNLLSAPFFKEAALDNEASLRRVVTAAVQRGIPTPAMGASLAYFDAYRSDRLPANLIQAQRDYFGAHTFKRVDRSGDFHFEWKGFDPKTCA